MGRRIDITGQRFGKLIALEFVGHSNSGFALWKCKCDCGNTIITRGSALRSGTTKSCGCLKTPDIIGQRFGRLVVQEDTGRRKGRRVIYKCKCDCGNYAYTTRTDLNNGHTQSCGCLMMETTSKTFTRHGESKSRLYVVWTGMKNRTQNESHRSYSNYGGRGIKVCDEWQTFEPFMEWALANGYDENAKQGACTIDRIDVNGDYEPSNCRWVDMKTQARNTRKYLKAHQI